MGKEANLQRKRQFWSDEEDARLMRLVELYGIHSWPEVAAGLHGRDSKSCSLRWRYFLAPHIIRTTDQKLSDWEVAVLFWTQREHGNKWRHIVDDFLPWRSPNDLKNYCNQYISSKGSQIISQNKLLLQGVPLQVLLSNPPAEVTERWKNLRLTQGLPHIEQRPVKKGTRGLSYILRQAAKQPQRCQPYTRAPPAAPPMLASSPGSRTCNPLTADPAAAGAATAFASAHTFMPGAQVPGGYMQSPAPQGASSISSLQLHLRPVLPSGARATAGAGAGYAQPQASGPYLLPAATRGLSFVHPAPLQLPYGSSLQYSSASNISSSTTMPSPRAPTAVAAEFWGSAGAFDPLMMTAQAPQSSVTQAAGPGPAGMSAGASSAHMQQQQQLPPPWITGHASVGHLHQKPQASTPSWSPADHAAAPRHGSGSGNGNGGSCSGGATPSSGTSCFTPMGFHAMNTDFMTMNSRDATPGSHHGPNSTSPGSRAPVGNSCSAVTGLLPGGAFGYQGVCSFSSSTHPQSSRGSFSSVQQQLDPPCCASGHSISSNDSSTFSLDPAGFNSPTNRSFSTPLPAPGTKQQQQQQQGTALAAHSSAQHQMVTSSMSLQQHQHHQQHTQEIMQTGPLAHHLLQLQEVQDEPNHPMKLQEQPPARSSGTGGAAAAAAAAAAVAAVAAAAAPAPTCIFDDELYLLLDSGSDDFDADFDAAEIADLLEADSYDPTRNNTTPPEPVVPNPTTDLMALSSAAAAQDSAAPAAAAAATAAVVPGVIPESAMSMAEQQPGSCSASIKTHPQFVVGSAATAGTAGLHCQVGSPPADKAASQSIDFDVLLMELSGDDSLDDGGEPFDFTSAPSDEFEAFIQQAAAAW